MYSIDCGVMWNMSFLMVNFIHIIIQTERKNTKGSRSRKKIEMIHLRKVLFVNWYKGNKDTSAKKREYWIRRQKNCLVVNETHSHIPCMPFIQIWHGKKPLTHNKDEISRRRKKTCSHSIVNVTSVKNIYLAVAARTNGWPEDGKTIANCSKVQIKWNKLWQFMPNGIIGAFSFTNRPIAYITHTTLTHTDIISHFIFDSNCLPFGCCSFSFVVTYLWLNLMYVSILFSFHFRYDLCIIMAYVVCTIIHFYLFFVWILTIESHK